MDNCTIIPDGKSSKSRDYTKLLIYHSLTSYKTLGEMLICIALWGEPSVMIGQCVIMQLIRIINIILFDYYNYLSCNITL